MFIFTSSNTLPLYASTKGTIQPLLFNTNTSLSIPASGSIPSTGEIRTRRDGRLKQPLYRSFKFLSLLSVIMALALTLPLVGFAAYPNKSLTAPATATTEASVGMGFPVTNSLTKYSDQLPDWKFPYPPGESTPATRIQTFVTPALAALTLLFGTPQLLITIPTFPPGSLKWLSVNHRRTPTPEIVSRLTRMLKKSAVGLSLTLLTLLPLFFGTSTPLRLLTITLSVLATYYVPPVLHVLTHTFKSPLSIILPSTYFSSFSTAPTPVSSNRPSTMLPVPGPSNDLGVDNSATSINGDTRTPTSTTAHAPLPPLLSSSSRHRHTPSGQEHDDLLQRKERSLQKRQMRRRIVWDIWAWGIFFGGFVVLGLGSRMLSGG